MFAVLVNKQYDLLGVIWLHTLRSFMLSLIKKSFPKGIKHVRCLFIKIPMKIHFNLTDINRFLCLSIDLPIHLFLPYFYFPSCSPPLSHSVSSFSKIFPLSLHSLWFLLYKMHVIFKVSFLPSILTQLHVTPSHFKNIYP